jgi:hypothetical protein
VSRQDRAVDFIVQYVRDNWHVMRDRPLKMIDAWSEDDRLLFVYETSSIVMGLDRDLSSPILDMQQSDTELATEIAMYSVLEPRGVLAPHDPQLGIIYWLTSGESTAWHPETLSELRTTRLKGRSR